MDLVVLAKVVPDAEKLSFDPATGIARREGTELFLNPFDQRALRVALDLRRPGETVTVVSMGPMAAEGALHETRGLGADRAILVSDRALAGSDSLVTARVLARVVARIGGGLVLTGRWSTDAETGQVPPQVAAFLDRPFVPAARRIARTEPTGLEVDGDTEDGWASWRVELPAVVSVGEKIAKIRKLLPEEVRASGRLAVDRWSIEDLGLDPSSVGLAASPTFVGRILDEAPTRRSQRFDAGAVADRVRSATAALQERLDRGAPVPGRAIDARSAPASGTDRFLVLLTGSDGRCDEDSLDLLGGVHRSLPSASPEGVWIGDPPSDDDRREAGGAGAARLWYASDPARPVPPERAVEVLARAAGAGPAPVGLAVSSTLFGRSVAGRLSAREGWGLTGDAVGMVPGEDGRPTYRKPAFGGRWVAEIGTRQGPALVTVRPGAFGGGRRSRRGDPAPVETIVAPEPPLRVHPLGRGTERDERWGDPRASDLLVVVGQGVGGTESVAMVRDLARSVGAGLGATRRVVDLGWAPRQLQIGLTGLSVEPAVAVLVGVGGAANHLVGLRRAKILLAVNHDPAAPVFDRVDLGIVGDWKEVLPVLVPALRAILPIDAGAPP